MRRSLGTGLLRYRLSLICMFAPLVCCAQQQPGTHPAAAAGSSKPLSIDRIYSEPSLSGSLTRGIAWTPDSKQISFFENNATGKTGKAELWTVEIASGQRRALIFPDKFGAVLPAEGAQTTQA